MRLFETILNTLNRKVEESLEGKQVFSFSVSLSRP